MEKIIDLHVHTTASDGEYTPTQVVDRAAKNGVNVMSITDHDTVLPYKDQELYGYADRLGIVLLPGIEISAVATLPNKKETGVHVLGIDIDPESTSITDIVEKSQRARISYTNEMISMFQLDGWDISPDDFDFRASITKAHIADVIIGKAANRPKVAQFFGTEDVRRGQFIEATMNPGYRYYRKKTEIGADEAIQAIKESGGAAILAHPVSMLWEQNLELRDIDKIVGRHQFDGIEAIYYYFAKSEGDRRIEPVQEIFEIAKKHKLLISGGSDFHGDSNKIGNFVDVGLPGQPTRLSQAQLEKITSLR